MGSFFLLADYVISFLHKARRLTFFTQVSVPIKSASQDWHHRLVFWIFAPTISSTNKLTIVGFRHR